jgi:aminomethyltransferase
VKRTPLFEAHKKLGARFIEFFGWEMPVQYTTIIQEHNSVRNNAGLFDTCHMGRLEVYGPGSLNFLQKLVPNDVSKLEKRQALYTPMCYENGTIVDDLIIYKLDDDHFFVVVNGANKEKDLEWMEKHKQADVKIKNVSNDFGMIAFQGPKAQKVLQKLTGYDLSQLKYFWIDHIKIDNIKTMTARTGYTGEDGFEIYPPIDKTEHIWNKILEMGKDEGSVPIGLGARNTLRIEPCYMLYGNDIDDTTTPLEAPLAWTVKFHKVNFIGREKLLKQSKKGVEKTFIGFEMIDRGIPRHNYKIFVDVKEVGHVTSGTFSPTLKKNIGLGYIDVKYKEIGNEIKIQIRDNFYRARIVKIPFYRREKQ